MIQIMHYIIALANLYGMVHKDKIAEIYNSQNEEQVTIGDVEKILSNPPRYLKKACILVHKGYFVKNSIIQNNEFEIFLRRQADKPSYVPEKWKLLRYVDNGYVEESKQYEDFLNYLKKNLFEPGDEKAECLAEDIQGMCRLGLALKIIFGSFDEMKLSFEDENQANEVLELIMELYYNTRIWANNGHTPHELYELIEKQNLRPLPEKPFDYGGSNVIDMKTRQKIG